MAAQNAFTGTVTVTPSGLPDGVTASPIDITAGSTGTVTLHAGTSTGSGPFTISLTGKSGTLSHASSLTLAVPLGGVAPVRLQECGSASSSQTFEMINDPQQSNAIYTEGADHFITIQSLPTLPTNGVKDYSQYSVYETAHALQYDLLHDPARRATLATSVGMSLRHRLSWSAG